MYDPLPYRESYADSRPWIEMMATLPSTLFGWQLYTCIKRRVLSNDRVSFKSKQNKHLLTTFYQAASYIMIEARFNFWFLSSCLTTVKIECFIYRPPTPPPPTIKLKKLYTKSNCIICNQKYLEVNIVFDQVHYIIKSTIKYRSNEGISSLIYYEICLSNSVFILSPIEKKKKYDFWSKTSKK